MRTANCFVRRSKSFSIFCYFSLSNFYFLRSSDDICEGAFHFAEVPHAAEQEHNGDEDAKE